MSDFSRMNGSHLVFGERGYGNRFSSQSRKFNFIRFLILINHYYSSDISLNQSSLLQNAVIPPPNLGEVRKGLT